MITLYHGSNMRIASIDLNQCNPYKDFGQAFYLSADKNQAMDIAIARVDIFGGEPVVNDYRFDENMLTDGTMSFKSFDGYTEEWADFVYLNRDESIVPPYEHPYDVFWSKFTTCRITQMRVLSANHFSLVCYFKNTHFICIGIFL